MERGWFGVGGGGGGGEEDGEGLVWGGGRGEEVGEARKMETMSNATQCHYH